MDKYSSDDPFHLLIGRALIDERYRGLVLGDADDRVAALKEIGIAEPSEDQLRALEAAVGSLDRLAGVFGMETRAA